MKKKANVVMLSTKQLCFTQEKALKTGDVYIGEGFAGQNFFTWLKSQEEIYPNKIAQVIIATTDPELWMQGVPKIPIGFVEQYVKLSSSKPIKEVMLKYEAAMQQIATGEMIIGSTADYNMTKLSTRSNGTVIISSIDEKEFSREDVLKILNQYDTANCNYPKFSDFVSINECLPVNANKWFNEKYPE